MRGVELIPTIMRGVELMYNIPTIMRGVELSIAYPHLLIISCKFRGEGIKTTSIRCLLPPLFLSLSPSFPPSLSLSLSLTHSLTLLSYLSLPLSLPLSLSLTHSLTHSLTLLSYLSVTPAGYITSFQAPLQIHLRAVSIAR